MKWASVFRRQTGLCVVFLHGWGASPPEVAPVDERLAEALGANLLRFRLTGHGYEPEEGKSGEELHRGGVAVAAGIDSPLWASLTEPCDESAQ